MKSKMKEAHRRDAALLLRLLSILVRVVSAGKDVFFIVPQPSSSAGSVMDLKGIVGKYRKQLRPNKYMASPSDGDCTYEIITNAKVFDNNESLELRAAPGGRCQRGVSSINPWSLLCVRP